jgi:hypothetical protein
MKKVLVRGAGGVAGMGMTRCLQDHFDVYGEDDSKWARKLMIAKPSYDCEGPFDLIIPVADSMITRPDHPTILPELVDIRLCQDKAKCSMALGDLAPITYWVRDTHGAGGKGAQMASEYLPGDNYSCEVAFVNGELIGHFIKHRLSYSTIKKDLPLEKRGSSMVSVCVDNPDILQRTLIAIERIGGVPHGAYGVDFKCNEDGVPLITEINPGRFLTASYVYFYSTGYNLPLALYKAYFGESYNLGEYPEGMGIIRCVDSKPWVGKINEII